MTGPVQDAIPPRPTDPGPPSWRRSSRSGPSGGQCVEVAAGPDRVAVRDSKDVAGPVLVFGPPAWACFLAELPARVRR